jgi:hypothetical protein
MPEYALNTETWEQWQMPPAQLEELPTGLIEDQI